MGIHGLLPFLQDAMTPIHISSLKGQTAAIDAFSWLHRGAIGCAIQLCTGESTEFYVQFCLKYLRLLIANNIKPIMVFDGCKLPAKAPTDEKRKRDRILARHNGAEMLVLGKREEAYKYFKMCIEISTKMVQNLIAACRLINVDVIVAPYEADAQIAFLTFEGIADFVITEDSDLTVFGCRKILYKLKITGDGMLYEQEKLPRCMKILHNGYTFEKFRRMCILSGCDYLNSLPGVGIKNALKVVSLTAETDPMLFLDKMHTYMGKQKFDVPLEYKQGFLDAEATFLYQIVYNPKQRRLQTLNTVPNGMEAKLRPCIGAIFHAEVAYQLAIGNVNPVSMMIVSNWTNKSVPSHSIWALPGHSVANGRQAVVLQGQKPPVFEAIDRAVKRKLQEGAEEDLLQLYRDAASAVKESPERKKGKVEEEPLSPVIELNKNPFLRTRFSRRRIFEERGLLPRSDSSPISSESSSSSAKTDIDVQQSLLTPDCDLVIDGVSLAMEAEKENETSIPKALMPLKSEATKPKVGKPVLKVKKQATLDSYFKPKNREV